MKFLRPRNPDSGLVTVLLVSDAELETIIEGVSALIGNGFMQDDTVSLKKLRAELKTARKVL